MNPVPDTQDSTCISIANGDGIKIFSLESNKIVFSANIGAIKLCQMLNSTSLLAYVGSGLLLVRSMVASKLSDLCMNLLQQVSK
jgi:hypothetical protein